MRFSRPLLSLSRAFVLSLALPFFASPASASLFLSTTGNAALPGLSFSGDDVALWDEAGANASLALDDGNFSGNENIDAFHRLDSGSFLISTSGNATLGGLTFGDDDIVLYDPGSDTASLAFDGGALFSNGNEDVDAVSVLSNGNLLLSTRGNATLGGLTFRDGDLVEYDAVNDVATLFFSEDLFLAGEDVDAVHAFADGTLLISTQGNASLAGLAFGDDDVVRYDPLGGTAALTFDGAHFASAFEDVDAVAVREAPLLALFALPLLLARRN